MASQYRLLTSKNTDCMINHILLLYQKFNSIIYHKMVAKFFTEKPCKKESYYLSLNFVFFLQISLNIWWYISIPKQY